MKDGTEQRSRKEGDESIFTSLKAFGVSEEQLEELNIEVQSVPNSGAIFNWLIMLLPMILIFAFFIFIMRQAGGGGQNRAMQFGRSRARKMDAADRPTVTFDDVAGADEAKQELEEVVEFLREPQKFAALGARIPKGVLMVGAPGTGKTLLGQRQWPARPACPSSAVPALNLSRCLSASAPAACAISLNRPRRIRPASSSSMKSTRSAVIAAPDWAAATTSVSRRSTRSWSRWTASTARPTSSSSQPPTDPTFWIRRCCARDVSTARWWSTGRTRRGREAILKVHVRGKPMSPDIDLGEIAAQTPGMVGADLENLINEAAILAARRNKRAISMDELHESIERVMAGPARRSRVLDERDRKTIAYHEAGHAIVMETLAPYRHRRQDHHRQPRPGARLCHADSGGRSLAQEPGRI